MISTIHYGKGVYPSFQTEGNASQFAIPFAKHVCKGKGYDIGCNRIEWSFPGSIPIDLNIDPGYDARNLPKEKYGLVDYIFSSHCLEHIPGDWYEVLKHWRDNLTPGIGGVIFLYLPDYSQEYWRPWNNRKHLHVFTPEIMKEAFYSLNLTNIFVSGVDLNNSFMIMGQT